MRDNIQSLNSRELDPDEKREYDDLLLRLALSADILRDRREAAEKSHRDAQEKAAFMALVAPLQSRLAELIQTADRLMEHPEGIPSQYAPTADQLRSEVSRAKDLLQGRDPSSDPIAQKLKDLTKSAEETIPRLSERASLWDQFCDLRNRIQANLDRVFGELPQNDNNVLLPVVEGRQLFDQLMPLDSTITEMRNDMRNLSDLADQLHPLTQVEQEIRFLSVDVESAEDNYNSVLDRLNVEINDEEELERTLNILSNELQQYREDVERGEPISHDRLSYRRLLDDMIAHLDNQRAIVERSENARRFIRSDTRQRLDDLIAEARALLDAFGGAAESSDEDEEPGPSTVNGEEPRFIDKTTAARLLAELYPDQDPREVVAERVGELGQIYDTDSEFDSLDTSTDSRMSPLPEDATEADLQVRRQRSRWRRVLRTALPLQVREHSLRYASSEHLNMKESYRRWDTVGEVLVGGWISFFYTGSCCDVETLR
ncbi:hypothetical protein WR25_00596 isoform C [Diploscapter pachys]|uniref:Nuclear anchorage protein 1 spectrin-like repeat domain-containing protein n=1 Tax=Diploscapter pachys TaxID=2018661 RepID=A0A2A2KIB9_9BILA|nr:hypothetical protein WR25_00596 isoform C [Diploscapter pachys]